MNNDLTYTQDRAEWLINNMLPISKVQLNYNSTYGYGNTPNDIPRENYDWKGLKEDLFNEYDELWKELAAR